MEWWSGKAFPRRDDVSAEPQVGPLIADQQAPPHEPGPPQVPPAPVNKDDFTLVQRPGPGLSQESARRYGELTKLIRQQHEVRGPPAQVSRAPPGSWTPIPPLTVFCLPRCA